MACCCPNYRQILATGWIHPTGVKKTAEGLALFVKTQIFSCDLCWLIGFFENEN
jgi:hypothetical protein